MSSTWIRLMVVAFSISALFVATTAADVPFERFKSSAPVDGEVFILVSTNSGRCLTLEGGSKRRGASVVQGESPARAGNPERWKVVACGKFYKLINENSGQVLAVPEASGRQGEQIIQWDDKGTEDQQWTFVKVGNHYSIKSRASGLVLGVSEARKDAEAPVVQWELAEIPDQIWFIQWVPGLGEK